MLPHNADNFITLVLLLFINMIHWFKTIVVTVTKAAYRQIKFLSSVSVVKSGYEYSSTLGAMLRHKEYFTDKSLSRAESLEVTCFSNSSSQLDTLRLSSVNGLVELSVLNSNKLITLRLSALQVDLKYWNNLYYQDLQVHFKSRES